MSEDAEFTFFSKCSAVVLDVAGTTTSIEFVKDTLFPFADKNCEEYLKDNFDNEDVKKALKLLKEDLPDVAAAVAAFKELSAGGSDNEGLKIIQGLIYKEGYASEKLKAHTFSDVPLAFDTWAKTMKVAIYSTGSIDSQKLLFAHTTEGDITSHITHYFDQTNIGTKTDKDSYEKIAKELGMKPEEVVFVSDDVKELKAAKDAKLFTVLVKREGNDEVPEDDAKEHSVVATFTDLVSTGKRKCPVDETPEIKEPPTKVAKTEKEIAASEEPIVPEKKKDDEEKMEVDSTTESKEDKEAVPAKEAEKIVVEPEMEEAKKEESKMDTNEEVKKSDKVIETVSKDDNEKEGEITSTNEEEVKKSTTDDKATSQAVEKVVTEEPSKEPSVVDSTDAVTTAPTTTVEKSADKPVVAVEEEMVVDATDKEKTVETKGETEKTDNPVVKDVVDVEKAKVEEDKTDKKEIEEKKTVEEVVPSSNGDTKHEKTDETVKEKEVIEEADSATDETVADTANGEAVKVIEKENKSELANGKAENGKAENGDAVIEEVKKTDEEKSSSDDIKVKKIEEASEAAAPVSVET